MLNLLLMILSTLGMLGVGWFVWKKLQAQEDAHADDTPESNKSEDDPG